MRKKKGVQNNNDKIISSEVRGGLFNHAVSFMLFVLAFVCITGLCVTLWYFISDINNTNNYFDNAYQSIGSSGLQKEQIEQLQILENVYKSSRTFDVMSFFYMFASSILIGLVIFYYNKINAISTDIAKSDKQKAMQLRGVAFFNEVSNYISITLNRLGILESLFVQSKMSNNKASTALTSKYLPRLRNDLLKSSRALQRFIENKSDISYSISQVEYFSEMFFDFKERVETIYTLNNNLIEKDTKDEFVQYIEDCLSMIKTL